MQASQDFRYTDPRTLDGDVFAVTAAAFLQTEAVGDLYATAIEDSTVFARNAEMERQLMAGGEPDGAGFIHTALGKRLSGLSAFVAGVQQSLKAAAQAASYDPAAEVAA